MLDTMDDHKRIDLDAEMPYLGRCPTWLDGLNPGSLFRTAQQIWVVMTIRVRGALIRKKQTRDKDSRSPSNRNVGRSAYRFSAQTLEAKRQCLSIQC